MCDKYQGFWGLVCALDCYLVVRPILDQCHMDKLLKGVHHQGIIV